MLDFIKNMFTREPIVGNYCVENNTINDVLIVSIPCLEISDKSKFLFEIDIDAKITFLNIENKKSINVMITSLENLPTIINIKYKEIK
jgi:hypothetical protein